MKVNSRKVLISLGALFLIAGLYQNCANSKFESLSLEMESESLVKGVRPAASRLQMPLTQSNFAIVNVGSQSSPLSRKILTTSLSVANLDMGSTISTLNSGTNASRPIVTARNGCGSAASSGSAIVEYHLNTGECNHSVSNFVVQVELQQLTKAFVCFLNADQVQSSRYPAPEKCLKAQQMTASGPGKFTWYSDNFWAFDGIEFTNYRAEVYSDQDMKNQIGQVEFGLRFPRPTSGTFFDLATLEADLAKPIPLLGWSSTSGDFSYYMGCGGMGSGAAEQAGWKKYNYPVWGPTGIELADDCYYKIVRRKDATSTQMASCEFPGGKIEGYDCVFESARAENLKPTTARAVSGGVGSAQAYCSNGKWVNIVVNCTPPPVRPCVFTGHLAGYSAIFESITVQPGQIGTSRALAGGTGSISAKCIQNDNWTDFRDNFTPQKSCTFPGGRIDGYRGTFAAARALHNACQTTYSDQGESVTAQCNNESWRINSPNCRR